VPRRPPPTTHRPPPTTTRPFLCFLELSSFTCSRGSPAIKSKAPHNPSLRRHSPTPPLPHLPTHSPGHPPTHPRRYDVKGCVISGSHSVLDPRDGVWRHVEDVGVRLDQRAETLFNLITEVSALPTYLPTLPACLPACLPYLPTYLPTSVY